MNELNEVTYFVCLNHLIKTMSKMPWKKLQHTEAKGKERLIDTEMDFLLNLRPNPKYSASTFWSSVELNRLHHGNAFAYIEAGRDGKAKHLWVLPSEQVQVWVDNATVFGSDPDSIWYIWTDSRTGQRYKFRSGEILHFKTEMTFNGIIGLSVRQMLKTQLNTQLFSQSYLKKLYENNMFGGKVILQYTGDLSSTAEEKIATKIETYSKSKGSGKFIPLPLGIEAKLLDMKLSDAQFFENNKLSALQIAAAFGVKPNIINDYSKSSYSNSETQQLDFFVNTLQSTFNLYEQEVTYKLLFLNELKNGIRFKINERVLFKMDSKTQSIVYGKYLNNFVMTPNEVREELDLPNQDGADELIGNGNYIKISQVGEQYKKGGNDG